MYSMNNYYYKYNKYKNKYLLLKNKLIGGSKKLSFDKIFTGTGSDSSLIKSWYKLWTTEYKDKDNKIIIHNPSVTFNDIRHRIRYTEDQGVLTTNLHDGQRKLFMSEIQFLTKCLDSHLDQKVVVYAGAAPSMKAFYALRYFPNIVWILVDPHKFKIMVTSGNYSSHNYNKDKDIKYINQEDLNDSFIKDLDMYNNNNNSISDKLDAKIFIIQDVFTNSLADKLSKIKNLLFITDIRTNESNENPSDIDIIWNLSQGWEWMLKMKPLKSLLKFKHPFYTDKNTDIRVEQKETFNMIKNKVGVDMLDNYRKKRLMYLPGELFLQVYAPVVSTETRLFVKQEDINKSVNYPTLEEYEDKFVYFNKVQRSFLLFKNRWSDKRTGFDHCQDCSLTALIWDNYIKKYSLQDKTNPLKEVKKYQHFFRRPLIKNGHGKLFGEITQDRIDEIVTEQGEVRRKRKGL